MMSLSHADLMVHLAFVDLKWVNRDPYSNVTQV